MPSANGNTTNLNMGGAPNIGVDNFSSYASTMVATAVSRNNYEAALGSDAKLQALRESIYRMVSGWSFEDKMAILTEYGEIGALGGNNTPENLSKVTTEAIIIHMNPRDFKVLYDRMVAKEVKLKQDIKRIEDRKAMQARKYWRQSEKAAKTPRSSFNAGSFENTANALQTAKNGAALRSGRKAITKGYHVPKMVNHALPKLRKELIEVLYSCYDKLELMALANDMNVDIDTLAQQMGKDPRKIKQKDIINAIVNRTILYVELLTGKSKKMNYVNSFSSNVEPYNQLLQYTSYAFITGKPSIGHGDWAKLKYEAQLAKRMKKEKLKQKKYGEKVSKLAHLTSPRKKVRKFQYKKIAAQLAETLGYPKDENGNFAAYPPRSPRALAKMLARGEINTDPLAKLSPMELLEKAGRLGIDPSEFHNDVSMLKALIYFAEAMNKYNLDKKKAKSFVFARPYMELERDEKGNIKYDARGKAIYKKITAGNRNDSLANDKARFKSLKLIPDTWLRRKRNRLDMQTLAAEEAHDGLPIDTESPKATPVIELSGGQPTRNVNEYNAVPVWVVNTIAGISGEKVPEVPKVKIPTKYISLKTPKIETPELEGDIGEVGKRILTGGGQNSLLERLKNFGSDGTNMIKQGPQNREITRGLYNSVAKEQISNGGYVKNVNPDVIRSINMAINKKADHGLKKNKDGTYSYRATKGSTLQALKMKTDFSGNHIDVPGSESGNGGESGEMIQITNKKILSDYSVKLFTGGDILAKPAITPVYIVNKQIEDNLNIKKEGALRSIFSVIKGGNEAFKTYMNALMLGLSNFVLGAPMGVGTMISPTLMGYAAALMGTNIAGQVIDVAADAISTTLGTANTGARIFADTTPRFATGGKNSIITGDSAGSNIFAGGAKPELVTSNGDMTIRPLNKTGKENQTKVERMTQAERRQALATAISSHVLKYSYKLPDGADDVSNVGEAIKVYNVKPGITDEIEVGGQTTTIAELLYSIYTQLEAIGGLESTGNDLLTAIATQPKQPITVGGSSDGETPFTQGFSSNLDSILGGK